MQAAATMITVENIHVLRCRIPAILRVLLIKADASKADLVVQEKRAPCNIADTSPCLNRLLVISVVIVYRVYQWQLVPVLCISQLLL
ncbi:hypothetical protein D3C74_402940 [compost metagenome]